MQYVKPKRNVPEELVNENLHFREVLVIGPDGQQLGTMMRREAIEKAYDLGLDLYCVAPNAKPPVCKILDYGKHRFNEQKKARESKKKQLVTEFKPLRLSPVIDDHDFDTKLKHARSWIEDGQNVWPVEDPEAYTYMPAHEDPYDLRNTSSPVRRYILPGVSQGIRF